jgi:hypothetical protein
MQIYKKSQNFQKILKISKFSKNFKISKFSKNFKISKFQKFQNERLFKVILVGTGVQLKLRKHPNAYIAIK